VNPVYDVAETIGFTVVNGTIYLAWDDTKEFDGVSILGFILHPHQNLAPVHGHKKPAPSVSLDWPLNA
jgi:hypothetical protein